VVRCGLIGRSAEQIALGQDLQDIKHGFGKVFIIEGEAGVGKTRLVEKIESFAENLGINIYRSISDSGNNNQKYLPWREILWQQFNLDTLHSDQERINRLAAALDGSVDDSLQGSGLMAILSTLGTINNNESLQKEIDHPEQIPAILSELLTIGLQESPSVVIIENAQDLDPDGSSFKL